MHFSTSFILAALPFLAAATQPLKARQSQQPSVYSMTVVKSSYNSSNTQSIIASNGSFFVYRQTSSLCGSDDPTSCNKPTLISLDNSQAVLSVSVPGGQSLFVTPTGNLSYTAPHSRSFPPGSRSNGFSAVRTGDNDPSTVSNLYFDDAPVWFACPVEIDRRASWQIFANVTGVQLPDEHRESGPCHLIGIGLVPGDASESPFEFE